MPVVARSIPIPSGLRSVSLLPRIMLLTVALTATGSAAAQDGIAPSTPQESSATSGQQPTPLPDVVPAESVPHEAPATAVAEGCLPEILKQHQLTKTLREMRNPLLPLAGTPEADKLKQDYDKLKRDYALLLTNGFGASDVKKVQDVLSYRILQATDGDFVLNPANMQNLLQDVKNDVARCGNDIGNAANQRSHRRKFCLEVLTVIKQLLSNNLDSRIAAVNIMRMLYEVNPPAGADKPILLKESLTALLEVMADKEQPDSVKVAAANSLRNILRNCEMSPQDQCNISDAIGLELARPCCESAYQMVLLDTLFEITTPRRVINPLEPTAFKHFAVVLKDKTRPIEVRCHAAFGIGQAAYDPSVNFEPFAWKIAELALETGVEFTKARDNAAKWQGCGADLFFAFRPFNAAAVNKGLLNRAPRAQIVAGAAPLVLTTAVVVLTNANGVALDDLKAIRTWADANKPQSMKWFPDVQGAVFTLD